ncbi:hypothetical protein SteCoe_23524 [Stentor coeruleus]|uniref:AAA+ ATPase domain-containing protein n=1 Tax=Stentor coeruleus TaxID=5963 RepID=A0A1R2BJN7_9CILI|nr:hypothetical protein SteCoe_23524 [Stentor coeruleus]
MLKRKSGNASTNTIIKKPKNTKQENQENKYEQKTISQTFFLQPKVVEVQKSTMHPQTYGLISSYMKEYKKRIKKRTGKLEYREKSIIIQGLPGSGKTHFVRQIAEDFSVRILEFSTSSLRSKGNISKILGEASQTFSIDQGENNGTIIFIDDVDIILEPDKGFYQGIESIISSTKCPVIMTCEKIPDLLINNSHIKVYKLNSHKIQALEIMKNIRNTQSIFMSDIEIEHLYNKAKGNLNTIMNYMWAKDLNLIYGTDVSVESPISMKYANPKGIIYKNWESCGLNIEKNENLDLYLQCLQDVDILQTTLEKHEIEGLYRTVNFHEALEDYYLSHRDKNESFFIRDAEHEKIHRNYKKIAREHFLHMSGTEDFVSYLQIIEKFPVSYQPSYLLRSNKKSGSYLDIVLQKNPNMFYVGSS